MATNRMDGLTTENGTDPASVKEAVPAVSAVAGGFKAWLPLIANVILMPVLAYVMTVFVLLPKMNSGTDAGQEAGESVSAGDSSGSQDGKDASAKNKVNVPLSNKVLVNVSGTMGTRYLLANITLVGTKPDLKEAVEKNDAQLRDVAAGVLGSKTITDIDKPGARNLIRTELISAFNNVLGGGRIVEVFFTEFAIQ